MKRAIRCVRPRQLPRPQPYTHQRLFHSSPFSLRADASDSTNTASTPASPQHQQQHVNGPKAIIDIKHIRLNPELHTHNCIARNYKAQAAYPERIVSLNNELQTLQHDRRQLREQSNTWRRALTNPASTQHDDEVGTANAQTLSREAALEQAREVKAKLQVVEEKESKIVSEIESLALQIPNQTSEETPIGEEPRLLSYINDHPEPAAKSSDRVWRSHVHVGSELQLMDFASAGTSSGWGWYYLMNEGAQLEQALVQYALTVASRAGWGIVSPPSMVYSHIASACGFQPRDQNGETQIYGIAQAEDDRARGRPTHVLTGTAEIPLAGMKADSVLDLESLPLKRVAASRCYRAEAGSRGVDTKGLYRVHEFTKVELFAWTNPEEDATTEVFDEMLDLQTEILGSLGLHCRILEMPSTDLGASAARKVDMEAFFPSRRAKNDGWGEVTSASICTDYQTRRLGTRAKTPAGKMLFPWTVNGTAMAVPRVLAAILENGWDENDMSVTIPEVLRPWMDGMEKIQRKHQLR